MNNAPTFTEQLIAINLGETKLYHNAAMFNQVVDALKKFDPNAPEGLRPMDVELHLTPTGRFTYPMNIPYPDATTGEIVCKSNEILPEAQAALATAYVFKEKNLSREEKEILEGLMMGAPKIEYLSQMWQTAAKIAELKSEATVFNVRAAWKLWSHGDLNSAYDGNERAINALKALPFETRKEIFAIFTDSAHLPSSLIDTSKLLATVAPELATISPALLSKGVAADAAKNSSVENWSSTISERVKVLNEYLALDNTPSSDPFDWVARGGSREASRSRALHFETDKWNAWLDSNIDSFLNVPKNEDVTRWVLDKIYRQVDISDQRWAIAVITGSKYLLVAKTHGPLGQRIIETIKAASGK